MMETPSIQWFPGHMAKTKRLITKNLSLVDIVIEILDARVPFSSSNPDLKTMISNKPRLTLLNKSDIADPKITKQWVNYYLNRSIVAMAVDCRSGNVFKQIYPKITTILKDKIDKRIAKGMIGCPVRAMIVGIPNVGKSSLINQLASGKKTKVEDRPGVTRGKQWVSASNCLDLLDMPGILWPKFNDQLVAERLAFTGAVKDTILDIETLAVRLLDFLFANYRNELVDRYKFDVNCIDPADPFSLIKAIAIKRGMIMSKAEVDMERVAIMVLDEFRSGTIGRISLEKPPSI